MAWTVLRNSGKYTGYYRIPGVKDPLSAGTFVQEKEALRKAQKAEDEARQPGALDPRLGKLTWGSWFTEWHESRSLAYSTDMTYRSTADCHLMPGWRDTKLADIESLHVSRWVRKMQREGVSVWTVRSALMLLKTSLNAAVHAKRIHLNPATHVPYPDLPEGLERYLTPEEVERITFYMNGINALIVWVSVQTGMRFGEVSGLHWPRLNLERGSIQIVEKYDQKANAIDPLPKDNEQRSVPLPTDLVEMLVQYRDFAAPDQQRTCGLRHTAGRCIGDLVFRGPRGAALKSNDFGRGPWKRALEQAGIVDRVRPHDMRHTYASWLLQQGVSLPELAMMMGHADWEVTKKYAHLCPSATHETVRQALTDHRRIAQRIANDHHATLSNATPEIDDQAV